MANQPTNIGARGIRRRGRMGVVWLVLGIIVAITLVATRAPHGWRLLVILPFTAAAIGFLQAREKTCIVLAAMGQCEGSRDGSYRPVGADERGILRRRSAWIVIRAVLIAGAITAVIWWI